MTVDRVAVVSRRADGTPDQSENYELIAETADKVEPDMEIAADVQRPRQRSRKAAVKGKETR